MSGIVAAHHGSVEVFDTEGGGATFRVWLPCSPRLRRLTRAAAGPVRPAAARPSRGVPAGHNTPFTAAEWSRSVVCALADRPFVTDRRTADDMS
ncbi:hypothetical protein Q9Q99_10355 [Curtobacterium flaccumfaciens]|nr:hypothetical protein Q9Q99_10355 [Curtobacterium flaccumfaciens]